MKNRKKEALAARLMQTAATLFPLGIRKARRDEPVTIDPKRQLNPAKAMKP